jgi:CPA2 family monovalent cation:H+ antiporter-2
MHESELVLTLTGALTAAVVLGLLTQRLGLSPIVGYLLAGIVVGPFTPGFVAHARLAAELAEVGVVLLLFGVGLRLRASELLEVRAVALPGALVQISLSGALTVVVGRALGLPFAAGLVLGLAVSVASTVVVLRVLGDAGALHGPAAHVAIGWLVVEDLFTVLALVILPVLASGGGGGLRGVAASTALALGKVAALVALALVVGRRAVPALLRHVAATRSRELFTLAVLVTALGIAVGSSELFGVSMGLGAFIAGLIVGQTELGSRAASDALPMRDAFAVLFFVSVGMLFDPREVARDPRLPLALLAVIVLAKPLVAYAVARALRAPPRVAAVVAVALAQIGEFSFIVAGLGERLGLLPTRAVQALVAASLVSIALSPLYLRAVVFALRRRAGRGRAFEPPAPRPARGPGAQGPIVVGYGPVGRTVVRLLREYGLEPTVVELDPGTVRALRASGIRAVCGDATRGDILEDAGVREAASLVFTGSGSPPADVVHAAKSLNPALHVLVRSTFVSETPLARERGADVVVSAEAEVAAALAERLLAELGASGEELDRARDRVRRELAAPAPPLAAE